MRMLTTRDLECTPSSRLEIKCIDRCRAPTGRGLRTAGSQVSMSSADEDGTAVDMAMLARRIDEVKQGVSPCKLFVLESLLPGQTLKMTAPPELVRALQASARAGEPLIILGRQGQQLHTRGVEASLVSVVPVPVSAVHPEGTADIVLAGGRLGEVGDIAEGEDWRWLGRSARVRWIEDEDALAPAPDSAVLERSQALAESVDVWLELVRAAAPQRVRVGIDSVLASLGELPAVEQVYARVLWVASLINARPALGLTLEVRPAVLMAPNVDMRLRAVEMSLADSIRRLVEGMGH
jgi:hypothetical protein